MINEYHRPKSLEEALLLLDRTMPLTLPLGGGTYLSQHAPQGADLVDLSNLGFSTLGVTAGELVVGAMVTLGNLEKFEDLPSELRRVISYESTGNMRNRITVGGMLSMAKAQSPLLVSLLALSASMIWLPGEVMISLDDFIKRHQAHKLGLLIKELRLSLPHKFVFHSISRSPFSEQDICVAGVTWTDGRIRIAAALRSANRPELVLDAKLASISDAFIDNACSQYLQSKKQTKYQNKTIQTLVTRTIRDLI